MNEEKDQASQELTKKITKVGLTAMLSIIALALIANIVLNVSGISFYSISGNSMEPTFENRDSVILKQSKHLIKGEIIFFQKPSGWDDYESVNSVFVKRIAAVPGDTLSYDGEKFTVNGETLYQLAPDSYECEKGEIGYTHQLTDTQLFVLGDNANHSLDSRRIFCDGNPEEIFIPKRNVMNFGKIVFKF